MIVIGLNQGMQPIAGYNFGAKLYGRVNKVLKLTIIYATAVTTFGFLVGMLVPDLVVGIFTSDAELTELSVTGLRITVMFFPIIGFQMVTSNFFQSIGMAGKAIFLSPYPTDADSASLPAYPAAVLRSGRSVVQHAGIRFACKFDSIGDVGLSIPQIQNLSLVGIGRGRGSEFFFLLSADIP